MRMKSRYVIQVLGIILALLFLFSGIGKAEGCFLRPLPIAERTPVLATDANKQLMLSVLTIFINNRLIRQGKLPGLPGEWNDEIYFHLKKNTDNGLFVDLDFINGLQDEEFHNWAKGITKIIIGRANEGLLRGLPYTEDQTINAWLRFSNENKITDIEAEPFQHGIINIFPFPGGFRQAASLSDANFAAFINQVKNEFFRIVFDVMTRDNVILGEVRDRLAKSRGFAHQEVTDALCRRYEYGRALTKGELEEGRRNPVEELSPNFGILTTDFIDKLEQEGLLNDYYDVFTKTRRKETQNHYLLIEHLMRSEPITRASFSSQRNYDRLVEMLIDYKLHTSEMGVGILKTESQKREMMIVVQRQLNSVFRVDRGKNLLPLDLLMMFGTRQDEIHNKYGGRGEIKGVIGYTCPFMHSLNACRMMRTDKVTGNREELLTAALLHDLGKLKIPIEKMALVRASRDHAKESEGMVDRALDEMDTKGFTRPKRALIKVLVRNHAVFGKSLPWVLLAFQLYCRR